MRFVFVIIILSVVLVSEAQQVIKRTVIKKVPVDSSLFYKDTVIKWMTIEEAEAAQKKAPKKILIDIYTSWCSWCKVLDSVSYRNREIAHYVNQHFYPVRFDAEHRPTVLFKGVKYDFLRDENRWVHEFARYLLNGKMSYPGTAFIDETGNRIDAKNGYMDPSYLESVLNYYGSGSYKKMKYQDFEDGFTGRIPETN